jgi:hypothetical protein
VYFGPKFYMIARKRDVQVRTPSSLETNQSKFIITTAGGVGTQSRSRSRASRRSFADGSSVLLNFEEPPPSDDEVNALMGEVCDLLVAAAVLQDRKSGEEVLTQVKCGKEIGQDDEGQQDLQNALQGRSTPKTCFMKKEELLLFRSICSRLAKARFDFEKAGTQQQGGGGTTTTTPTTGKPSLKASSVITTGRSMCDRNSRSVSFAGDDSSTKSCDSKVATSPLLPESVPPIIAPLPLEKTEEVFAPTISDSSDLLCQQRIELDKKPTSCWSPILDDGDNEYDDPQDSSSHIETEALTDVISSSIEPPFREEEEETTTKISKRRKDIREQRRKQSKEELAEMRQRRQHRLAEREGTESQ